MNINGEQKKIAFVFPSFNEFYTDKVLVLSGKYLANFNRLNGILLTFVDTNGDNYLAVGGFTKYVVDGKKHKKSKEHLVNYVVKFRGVFERIKLNSPIFVRDRELRA